MKINYLFIALAFCAMQVQAQQCPTVLQCPVDTTILCYTNSNTAGLWQNMQFYDVLRENDDLTEAAVAVNLRLLDTCAAFVLPACHLFFDLNGDGLVESYFYSDSIQAPGTLRSTVGGSEQDLSFDQRALPDSMKYRLVVDTLRLGDTLEARLLFVNALGSTPAILPDAGVFDLIWLLDGDTLCRRHYRLRDCQPPLVTCLPLVSVNITSPVGLGSATVWTSDPLLMADDNATPLGKYRIGIIRTSESTGVFPEPPEMFSELLLNCADFYTDTLIQAELWLMDAVGNTSKCTTTIEVFDPNYNCGDPGDYTLSVCLKTEADKLVPGVKINLDFVSATTPFTIFQISEPDKCLSNPINFHPSITNYVRIKPEHRYNYNQGVTSFDLLLISKHIQGIEVLTSPYKMIAADANRSGSITAFDIFVLRRLVLGVDTLLQNNDSWRFIPTDYIFPNPINPFVQPLPDSIRLNYPLATFIGNDDFVAVKIGDINLNALPFTDNIPQDRNLNDSLSLILPRVQNGELVPIYFEKARLEGFQWSLQNVEPELLVPGPGLAEENFAWSAEHRTLRCSWISPDGAAHDFDVSRPVCWVKLKHAPEGLESGFVSEAYEAGAVRRSIRVEKAESLSLAPAQVVVAPNPTSGSAWVQGHLEQAGAWSFQVMDAQGRLLWERDGNTSDNALYLEIPATAIETTGLYFWVFSAGEFSQTGSILKF